MWIAISALNLAFAVILGAFGAHGLKARATEAQLAWWQTATDYFFTMRLVYWRSAFWPKSFPSFPSKSAFY